MIPNKIDEIKNLEDVKREYPKFFNLKLLKDLRVKKLIKEELEKLMQEEKDYCEFYSETVLSDSKLKAKLSPIAEAKGLYMYHWHRDHVASQMFSWGWHFEDFDRLIMQMKAKGYEPYSVTEDTVGEYLYQLPGHGYTEITLPNGRDSFSAYDPTGKLEKQQRRRQKKEQRQNEYY